MNLSIMHNINGEDVELNIVKNTSVETAEAVVDYIVSNVVYGSEYRPYRFYYCYWVGIINAYTDFDTSAYDDNQLFGMIDDTLVDKIRAVLSREQLDRIEIAANKKIEAELNKHPMKSICDDLSKGVNAIVNNFCDALADENVREELKKLITKENIGLLVQMLGHRT